MDLQNNRRTLFESFYSIKEDGSHILTLGCVVKVALPRESQTTGSNGLSPGEEIFEGGDFLWHKTRQKPHTHPWLGGKGHTA